MFERKRRDGEHDIETDETVMLLALKGLVEPCERGERPSTWSAYKEYDNVYFPMINLMVTGRCNFNCLHCFNAADNAALMTERSFEDICNLLDQARDCVVAGFQLTGGKPTAHRRFLDIVREIYKRDMSVFTLNTNGWYQKVTHAFSEWTNLSDVAPWERRVRPGTPR